MSDTGPLLVPIEVQAMVLNNPAVNFVRAQVNYDNLSNCRSPLPAPFAQDEVDFATHPANHGVYLRWTLPAAMRHGTQNAQGRLGFPLVPNRWLVVRIFRPATTAVPPPAVMPEVAAWIVQSDFLNSPAGSNFLDPTQAKRTQTQLGRKLTLTPATPWQEPAATTAYFLTAVAEGNPAFSTYQPFNQNVFSLHDNLRTQAVGAGTLSYYVQGWYSDPKADLLAAPGNGAAPASFSERLAALQWSASNAGTDARVTVYHGSAYGVPWQPDAPSPPPSPKDRARPHLAVSHTSVDAVVALMRAAFAAPDATPPAGLTPDEAAQLLEAFQYNLLPLLSEPGGEDLLEQKIRSQWFGSAAAGTSWSIVDQATRPGSAGGPKVSPEELAHEAQWLADLNSSQRRFDETMRELMGVQRTLFETWWKQQAAAAFFDIKRVYPRGVSDKLFKDALNPALPTSYVTQAARLLRELGGRAKEIPTAGPGKTLEEAIAEFAAAQKLPPARALKAVSRPRFWAPSDPVMVLSGAAHLLKLEPDAILRCRWPSEVITSLDVNLGAGTPAFAVTAAQLAALRPAIALANLPATTAALYAEFFLLDPVNAPLLAAAAGRKVTATELTALVASQAAPQPSKDAGAVPAVLAPYPWQQPWQPLYLDWEVRWYRIPFVNDAGAPNWEFNGTDYELVPGVNQPTALTLNGRSVLTPKTAFEFKARLNQFITDNRGTTAAEHLAGIERLIAQVDQWDFLSQAFSGLTTEVASWSPVPTLLPPSTPVAAGMPSLADLVGRQAQCPPDPQLATVRTVPESTFEAMRAGQFHFARVTIVDVFGQTVEVVREQTAPQTTITVGKGMEVTHPIMAFNPGGLAQLPPRLLQPARLNFEFVPGANGNPIVGWVLPNYLDGSVAVYGADGVLYGELVHATNAEGKAYVHYWPAPDTPFPTLAALAAVQAQLGGFALGLQNSGPRGLADFLGAVDETLWTVDPAGERGSFLSVLLGRPLAVVSATLSFELQAEVWRDVAWPYTFERPNPRLLKYEFPVQLGKLAYRHDGLIGYFVDGKYERFNVVHLPPTGPKDPPRSDYLAAIGAGNWVKLGFAARGPGPARALTLVMDPRASVHAQCGILPTKDVALVREWVDGALAKMQATFRLGPVLAEQRAVVPRGEKTPVESLLLPTPGVARGTWTWRQPSIDGKWPALPLAPVDANAVFPSSPPILRDGVLQLAGGIDG